MERNFDEYIIENLTMPVLILHSEDDNVASYKKVLAAKDRFPNLKLVSFPTGGHMMSGNGEAIERELNDFINIHQ
ncbi:MAG: alpha/beta hydrolase [Acholeplasmatales bacterium]|jgi:pimeloyl-ACP methyl ester carboxylesterase